MVGDNFGVHTLTDNPLIWVLLDDRAGNRSQALGVADALDQPAQEKELRYGPAAKLPNLVLGASVTGLIKPSKDDLQAPWPGLVISAGRRTAPVARWIKAQSGGETRLVQIMDPGSGRDDFDLICMLAHDQPDVATNTMVINGAPHVLTDHKLAAAAADWSNKLSVLQAPRIALMIGGSTRRKTFTTEMALELCERANKAAADADGTLMVTTSRRTGEVVDTISEALDTRTLLHRWDSDDENPYAGYLALADAIIVTGESVSMCSESCATGKPVYIFAPKDLITAKHGRLHQILIDGGYAKPFDGSIDLAWKPNTLNVAADIAAEIRSRGLLVHKD